MYYLLLLCLALSALLVLNALASLAAAALWRCIRRSASRWSAAAQARLFFTLRLFPAAGALVAVAALIIPSYLAYEPRPSDEVVSIKLVVLASISAVSITFVLWRGLTSWQATRRLIVDWMRQAEAISLEGVSIPVYRFEHTFPVVAVVGVIRPRLFVARRISDVLSDDELSAVVAHEVGHLVAHDNLKRILMRAAYDMLPLAPYSRTIERAWAKAVELAADEQAAHGGTAVALNLAAALVKIARLVPEGAKPAWLAGSLLVSGDDGGLAWRVRRLLWLAETGATQRPHSALRSSAAPWASRAGLSGVLVTLAFTAFHLRVLMGIHAILEHVLAALN